MARNPFGGFGFQQSSEIRDNMMKGLQQAAQSGNVNTSRMALAQNAANLLVKPKNLRDAENKENLLKEALSNRPESTDPFADQASYLRDVQKRAADAGMTDISLQAAEQLQTIVTEQDQRSRLLSDDKRKEREDEIREFTFGEAKDESEENKRQREFDQRQQINQAGLGAYRKAKQGGASEADAKLAALKGQLALSTAMASGDTGIQGGAKFAENLGIELSLDAFDPDSVAASLGETGVNQLKGLTTIVGENGEPQLMFTVMTDEGPQLVPTGETDFASAAAVAAGAGEGKVTDSQRKAANYALQVDQSQKVFDDLQNRGVYFTSSSDRLEKNFLNEMKSEDRQKFEQATANFIQTYLRDVSGATIKGEEIVLDTTRFIPQPGDDAAMVAQKAANRRAYQAGLQAQAGSSAYQEANRIYGILSNLSEDEAERVRAARVRNAMGDN